MPVTASDRVREFPKCGLIADKGKLVCEYCSDILDHTKKSTITNHLKSKTHDRKKRNGEKQTPIAKSFSSQEESRSIWGEMATAFVAAGIPLHVFSNETLRNWLTSNLKNGSSLPSERTLRRLLLAEGVADLNQTKKLCKEKDVVIIVDESQDSKAHKIVNVLVSPLEAPTHFRLLQSQAVERTTAEVMVQEMLSALNKIDVPPTKMSVDISDNANYMLVAGRTMQGINSKSLHSTCWAHVLHLVSEEIRSTLESADSFISKIKSCLVKSPARKASLMECLKRHGHPETLPPTPVITRWTTWLKTGEYHYNHFLSLTDWIEHLPNDSKAVAKLKSVAKCPELFGQLECIAAVYPSLSSTITSLESNSIAASEVYPLLETIRGILEHSPAFQYGLSKLNEYLGGKHPAINFWKDVIYLDPRKRVAFGDSTELPEELSRFTEFPVPLNELISYKNIASAYCANENYCAFKFWRSYQRELPSLSKLALKALSVPPSSAEVERSFSYMKNLLRPNRSSFTDENKSIHLRIGFNNRPHKVIEVNPEESNVESDEEY